MNKKQILEYIVKTAKSCGACGELYDPNFEGDFEGFHSAKFCVVRADEEIENEGAK